MRTLLITAVISIAFCAPAASQSASPVASRAAVAAPIGAYTVVPQLPGMGRPVNIAATASRRRALMRRIGRGTVLIQAGHERDIEQDYVQDNDFRQDNTFYYFTEIETQDAVLMMTARGPDSIETILFLPPRTPSQERWTGLRLGPDSTAVRLSGIAKVLPTDSLDRMLSTALFRAAGPVYAPLDVTTRDETRLKELVFAGRDVRNLRPLVDSMRLVKDPD